MDLQDCTIGMIVKSKRDFDYRSQIGWITGLDLNSMNEIVLLVHFAGESAPNGIHPSNVLKYEG